ncbi:MAG: PAS domain-containing sensor histidine kinase [Gammaproteobacteria bacterium]|nr:PAS domain-containing sensor histidine kinase [Gammaproteobacteria bacterium]
MLKIRKLIENKNLGYLIACLVVISFSGIAVILESLFLPKTGVLLVLQLSVVLVSIISNRLATTLAGLFCALVFNYFFTTPLYSLHMTEITDIINTLIFIIVAVITSEASSRYRKINEALKQAEIRSNILLSISHDLRTPLAAIIGALSTFKEYKNKIPQDKQKELIDGALEESHRLHHYVENLLQVTRMKNQLREPNLSAQPIWPILERAAKRFDPDRIALSKKSALPLVHIQGSLFEQAIYNIIDNAIKYSPVNQKVIIEAWHLDNRIYINITDKGPGIPEEFREKVFDLFFSSRLGDIGSGGSGIGLTVAKSIIEAHNGTLSTKPCQQGCVMEITLPSKKSYD